MKVKAKHKLVLDGKLYNVGEVFEIDKKDYPRVASLVEVVEEDKPKKVEEQIYNPEKSLEEKVVKKGRKKKTKN